MMRRLAPVIIAEGVAEEAGADQDVRKA